jgi:hypothetical protein
MDYSFQQEYQDHSMRKEESPQQMILGKLDIQMQNDKAVPYTDFIYKTQNGPLA